jgi:aubergine
LNQFRVELWPGFITSIRQHELNILTCVEVSHKVRSNNFPSSVFNFLLSQVMRQETIYDIMRNCRQDNSSSNWQDAFKRDIIGSIVLTAYNNNTYRIDDIDFNVNPSLTFDMRGQQISFVDYYQNKHQLTIRDRNQPMLVSNPSARDCRAGRNQPILLVPELCRATGLTDKMRSNFAMMKAMAEHTQMDPERRKARILTLTKRLYDSQESVKQLQRFDMEIDKDIVRFKGRALNQEKMVFGANKT